MKNLSVQEKHDLDICVFKTLGGERSATFVLFSRLLKKIKAFFTPNNKA